MPTATSASQFAEEEQEQEQGQSTSNNPSPLRRAKATLNLTRHLHGPIEYARFDIGFQTERNGLS